MKISTPISLKIISFIFLITIYAGFFSDGVTDEKSYIVVFSYLLLSALLLFKIGKFVVVQYPIIIAGIMLAVWGYGFLLGIINGNNLTYVIRNFAGMTAYILVLPLTNSGICNKQYICLFKNLSLYALYITIFTYAMLTFFHLNILHQIPAINSFVGNGGIGGFVQYSCRELIHVAFAVSFFSFVSEEKKMTLNILVIFSVLAETLFMNDSGGDALALGLLAGIIILTQIRTMKPRLVVICVVGIMCYFIIYFYLGHGLIAELFSARDGGNMRRIEEINYFRDNTTFIGHGLGKELFFAGSLEYNYGTEMIYLNLFHKFGIFAMLIIACYASTCFRAIKLLFLKKTPESVVPIALMAYLIPSLANPMLFSICAVIAHIIATIIISRETNADSELLS